MTDMAEIRRQRLLKQIEKEKAARKAADPRTEQEKGREQFRRIMATKEAPPPKKKKKKRITPVKQTTHATGTIIDKMSDYHRRMSK